MPDDYVKRWLMFETKMAKTVTEILNLSPRHFVLNVRYLHRHNQSRPKRLKIHLFSEIFVTNFWKGTGPNLILFSDFSRVLDMCFDNLGFLDSVLVFSHHGFWEMNISSIPPNVYLF